MDIFVFSREEIEAGVIVPSDYVVISIGDPDKPRARVKAEAGLRDVLYVAFRDAEPSPSAMVSAEAGPMTAAHAEAIRDFVRRHQGSVGAIVVHCEQGMSRSPAVAAAVSQSLGLDYRRFFQMYAPNRHVYDLVMDAFERGK